MTLSDAQKQAALHEQRLLTRILEGRQAIYNDAADGEEDNDESEDEEGRDEDRSAVIKHEASRVARRLISKRTHALADISCSSTMKHRV